MRTHNGRVKRVTMMTWLYCLALGLLLIAMPAVGAEETAGRLFQAGLYKEQIHGELNAAIEIYERILDEFATERRFAARALLHIGLCKEKLGQQEALSIYQNVVDRYPEQQAQVTVAKERIAEISKVLKEMAQQPTLRKIHIPNEIGLDAQLSPDGKSIAFVDEGALWVAPRSSRLGPRYTGAPRPLDTAGVEVDWYGFTWSADGRWIAFNGKEVREGCQRIYVVSADGGEPRQVHENNRDARIVNYRMSLSTHGETLAFTSVDANELCMYTLSLDGGAPKKLIDAPAREPVFSPDGTMIAYVEDKALGRRGGGLWVIPAKGGAPRLIVDAENASTPVWSPDGRMLAYVDYAADSQIHVISLEHDGTPTSERITISCPEGIEGVARLAGWTPDNQIGAIFSIEQEFALYTQSTQGGKATFVTHGGYPVQPRWSPDGKQIFHVNNVRAASDNWRGHAIAHVSAEGGDVNTLPLHSEAKIRLQAHGTGNHISPDGKTIVFAGHKSQNPIATMHIWTIPVGGGTPKQLTDAPAPLRDWYPCWSPDGQSIAFVRMKASRNWAEVGDANIFVIPAVGGEPKQMTSESDGVCADGPVLWSPDGKLLAYFSRGKEDAVGGTLRVIPPDGGESRVVAKVQRVWTEMAWSRDSTRVAYMAADNTIKIVSLDDGSIVEIKPDLRNVEIYHLDWSRDGAHFVFGGATKGNWEFWLIEDFLPEIGQRNMVVR